MTTFLTDFGGIAADGLLRIILLVALPLAALQLILMVAAIVNLVRKPVPGSDKILWLLLIVLVNLIGPIIYFAVGSNMLDEKAAKLEEEEEARRQ